MPMTANGLAKLLEELGELAQVAAKKLAYFHTDEHPDGAGSLKERLQDEMADVDAAMVFVQQQLGLDTKAIEARSWRKQCQFQWWHDDTTNGADAFDSGERAACDTTKGANHG